MRKRILSGAAGALLGVAAAPLVDGGPDLPRSVVFGGMGLIGLVLGFLVSIFADVFLSHEMDPADTAGE